MLGLFDSGLGGLTVVRRVRELLPQHDIVFFADQAHVPYGDRSADELHRLLMHNVALLEEQGAELIVTACNTSCAIAQQYGWPPSGVPVLDLIESAALAVERDGHKRIGVVATNATARTRAYTRAIRARVPNATVTEIGAPALVPLVEAGRLEGDEPSAAVREACAGLPRELDVVILACTHYPWLDAHFAAALGAGIVRMDPARVQAERAQALAAKLGIAAGTGKTTFITNGDRDAFALAVHKVLGEEPLDVLRLEPLAL